MLLSLQVQNFALIEKAQVDFEKGFNVFTGETGAGKSILIDAFETVLGGRVASSMARSGSDGFMVQAVFDDESDARIAELLAQEGIEKEEDGLFLKRRVPVSGKGQASINGVQVPVAVLKKAGKILVDIHGQHDNQYLLQPQAPLVLTDAFGQDGVAGCFKAYEEAYGVYRDLKKRLTDLEKMGSSREEIMEKDQAAIDEIEGAKINPGEEDRLKAEARILANSEKIFGSASRALSSLDQEGGALDLLGEARNDLQQAARYDESLAEISEALESAWIAADDVRHQLNGYLSSGDFDGERTDKVEERLSLLFRLKNKYDAKSEEERLERLAAAQKEYDEMSDLDETIARAARELERSRAELDKIAQKLTGARKKSADELCRRISDEIHELAMPEGVIEASFTKKADFSADGVDDIVFMFCANRGEAMLPLPQVASGGELSRLALAFKTVLKDAGKTSTMVFDEIDTGIGGVTAQKVAHKMVRLSKGAQVLCITHLPQIAAFADCHIRIEKEASGKRTHTLLRVLDHKEKVEEIMRMASGDNRSAAAKKSAEEMLKGAEDFKKSLEKTGGKS